MRYFTKEHEWINVEDHLATIGITNHAQEELGDVTYVELPQVGQSVSLGDEIAVIESTKAAASVYAPVSGTIESVNMMIDVDQKGDPSYVNRFADTDGWICKILMSDSSELTSLMDFDAYQNYLATLKS